jgi:hypothetical protein
MVSTRRKIVSVLVLGLVLLLASGLSLAQGPAPEAAMGTAFAYQGRLTDAAGPVNGTCSFTFKLYDQAGSGSPPTGGTLLGSEARTGVEVSDGLFTVQLDFGAAAFGGEARWLEIAVDCGEGVAVLSPRQALTPTPYALYAASAGRASWQSLQGVPAGFADGVDDNTTYSAGTGLVLAGTTLSLAPAYRLPQSCANGQIPEWNGTNWACGDDDVGGVFWSLSGNAGTTPGSQFLGTTDNKALELKVNSARVLRLEPNSISPNLLGGFHGNSVTAGVAGATIGGGGNQGWVQQVTDHYGTVGGGGYNQAGDGAGAVDDAAYATVGGGFYNAASGPWSAVGGGFYNAASHDLASVAGGGGNTASGYAATVGGGLSSRATADYATVSGGGQTDLEDPETGNQATEQYATIGGGGDNTASALGATVSGGMANTAGSQYATIGGGYSNETSGGWSATIAGGQQNTAVGGATVGGGNTNRASGGYATVAGGYNNRATEHDSTVGGGGHNQAGNDNEDTDDAQYATVGGGLSNEASEHGTTVAGGIGNEASGVESAVAGGTDNTASGSAGTIGGGKDNTASGDAATIAGGGRKAWDDTNLGNKATDNYTTVGGGANNLAGSDDANKANAEFATVAGGYMNTADGRQATVGGGADNHAAYRATVSGGLSNEASGSYSTIGGGYDNRASGSYAAIPGGTGNLASQNHTFAGGRKAQALHDGAFVWADANDYAFESYQANEFNIRATGGVRIALRLNSYGVGNWWCIATVANGGWSCTSDRNAKENLVLADGQQVLDRLEQVPIYYWSATGNTVRHLGPMAQDFRAAYGLGDDDTAISTIDLDGVALAAIQELNQRLQAQEAQIAAQQATIEALAARLAALEAQAGTAPPQATGGGR